MAFKMVLMALGCGAVISALLCHVMKESSMLLCQSSVFICLLRG